LLNKILITDSKKTAVINSKYLNDSSITFQIKTNPCYFQNQSLLDFPDTIFKLLPYQLRWQHLLPLLLALP
jgi:hypothetical protein